MKLYFFNSSAYVKAVAKLDFRDVVLLSHFKENWETEGRETGMGVRGEEQLQTRLDFPVDWPSFLFVIYATC